MTREQLLGEHRHVGQKWRTLSPRGASIEATILKDNETQIDVQLDAAFHVLASKSDRESDDGNS